MRNDYQKRKDYYRQRYLRLGEKIREQGNKWKRDNPDRNKAHSEKWRKSNPDKVKKVFKKWRDANLLKERDRIRIWFKENKEKVKEYKRHRRNLVYKAPGRHSEGEWETVKAQYNWTCPRCGKSEPEIKLTEDHIIALSKGGSDNIENIQPLCAPCNASKGNRISQKYERKRNE